MRNKRIDRSMRQNNRREKQSNSQLNGGDSTGDLKFAYIQPIQAQPLEVEVENFEKALRYFRTLVQKERILSLFKERSHFEKPSDKKRRKKSEAKRKLFELENKSEFSSERPRRPKFKDVGENDV